MNTGAGNSTYDSNQMSNTLAAIFATTHDAREAIKELHKAGFRKTWLATTRASDSSTGETLVDDASAGPISRLLSGNHPLHKALIAHGVSEDQALEVENNVAIGCAIVTLYGEDNPTRASQLLAEHKGQVVENAGAVPEAVTNASASPRVGVPKDEKHDHDHDHSHDRDNADVLHDDRSRGLVTGAPVASDPDAYAHEETEFVESRYPR